MQVVFNIDKQHNIDKPLAIVLGTFDGLHIGHQMLIQQLKLIKKSTSCLTLVYTFLNNPMELLSPEKAPSRIMTVPERILKFNSLGVDFLVLNPFDRELASMSPEDFIKDILIRNYNIEYVAVGYDFTFGSLGSGNTDLLHKLSMKYGFKLIIVPPVSLGNQVISSSLIRELIGEGDMETVSMYLGSPYSISGKVVHGFGRGKKLGYPTANLQFDTRKTIPKYGIYLTKVRIDDIYYWGMTNIGINPTFHDKGLFIETHVLDYYGDLYGAAIKIEFLKRIRAEKKFANIEDLKEQIGKDIQWAKNYVYKF